MRLWECLNHLYGKTTKVRVQQHDVFVLRQVSITYMAKRRDDKDA